MPLLSSSTSSDVVLQVDIEANNRKQITVRREMGFGECGANSHPMTTTSTTTSTTTTQTCTNEINSVLTESTTYLPSPTCGDQCVVVSNGENTTASDGIEPVQLPSQGMTTPLLRRPSADVGSSSLSKHNGDDDGHRGLRPALKEGCMEPPSSLPLSSRTWIQSTSYCPCCQQNLDFQTTLNEPSKIMLSEESLKSWAVRYNCADNRHRRRSTVSAFPSRSLTDDMNSDDDSDDDDNNTPNLKEIDNLTIIDNSDGGKLQETNSSATSGDVVVTAANNVEYRLTRFIVQGWIQKKGTGGDWIGSRSWKPRFARLCLGRAVATTSASPSSSRLSQSLSDLDVPILCIYWYPTSAIPSTVIVLDSTVVFAVNRPYKTSSVSTAESGSCRHGFEIRQAGSKINATLPVTRYFCASPVQARDTWVYSISDALFTYAKSAAATGSVQRHSGTFRALVSPPRNHPKRKKDVRPLFSRSLSSKMMSSTDSVSKNDLGTDFQTNYSSTGSSRSLNVIDTTTVTTMPKRTFTSPPPPPPVRRLSSWSSPPMGIRLQSRSQTAMGRVGDGERGTFLMKNPPRPEPSTMKTTSKKAMAMPPISPPTSPPTSPQPKRTPSHLPSCSNTANSWNRSACFVGPMALYEDVFPCYNHVTDAPKTLSLHREQ